MDTRFLETFMAVVNLGSIAEASRHLGLTPAAVAQRVQALEQEIGAKLLVRAGRSVRPTSAGLIAAEKCHNLLAQTRELKNLVLNDEIAGRLKLGAIPTAIAGMLAPMLRKVADEHPRIDLVLVQGTSDVLYQKVLAGSIDAALVAHPPFHIGKNCEWHLLREEPIVLIAPRSLRPRNPHRLLESQPFIRYDRSNWSGRLVEDYLRRHNIRPREQFELGALDAIAVLVDKGLGVSLIPDRAPPWPEGLSLQKLRLPPPSPKRMLGLLWLRSSPKLRLVKAVLKLLSDGKL